MITDTEAVAREVQRIESDRDWHGYLTLANAEAVAARLRRLLDGQRFTFVTANEGLRDGFPDVKTGLRLRDGGVTVSLKDGTADVGASCTGGSWGFYSDIATQAEGHKRSQAAWDKATDEQKRGNGWRDKSLVHLHFKHDRLEIEHFAPIGFLMQWTVAVIEYPEDDGD